MTDYSKYIVFDTETTVKNKGDCSVGNFAASPYHPDNTIVWLGGIRSRQNKVEMVRVDSYPYNAASKITWDANIIVVGQNIRFDLHYMAKRFPDTDFNNFNIWDIQLAEYILSGQLSLYPKLDDMAVHYGGTVKFDKVKDLMEAGIETEDIPKDMMLEYLEGDVLNTELVYLKQVEKAKKNGLLPLIESQMRALKATWNMEKNGMFFDQDYAKEEANKLAQLEAKVEQTIIRVMHSVFPEEVHSLLLPNSNDHLSALLFGGKLLFSVRRPAIDNGGNLQYFKTGAKAGQIKTKMTKVVFDIEGLNCPKNSLWLNKKGLYQTNESVLDELSKMKLNQTAKDLVSSIQELRRVKKDYRTYFKGYGDLVWPDGCIHGNINHCATGTGRLSSTSPNLQNVSSKET